MPEDRLPSLTAIVPTRDRPVLLRRALQAIVDQDYAGSIECLVVFDQSEPTEIDLALRPGRTLRTVRNARKPGLAGARNTGLTTATTELVAFCDDDDEWLPGKIDAQVELLQGVRGRGEEPGVISCGFFAHYDGTDHERVGPESLGFQDFLRSRHLEVHPCSVVVPREMVLGPIGLVDEELPGSYAEDWEWLLRASRVAPVRSVPRPLLRVYWHSASYFTTKWETTRDALLHLLERYPEFATEPRGLGRVEGQIAFAHAALGERKDAWRMARRALRHNSRDWQQLRAVLAVLVAARVLKPDWVVAAAHRTGRGIS